MERASRGTTDARLRDMVGRLQAINSRIVTSDTTLTENDDIVLVDTSGGNVTITLPSPDIAPGVEFRIKKVAAANTVTLDGGIDGSSSFAFTTQNQSVTVTSVIVTAPATRGYVIT